MCKIKSAIVLKDRIFCPLDTDSHEDMIEQLKLKDDTDKPNFVRIEMIPKDDDIFNHDLKNWVLKVDQDFKPDWFSEKMAQQEMKEHLEKFFAERFIINDRTGKKVKDQRIFVKNSSVEARENSSVVARENSSVVAWENSSVEARENSRVEAWGNSSVEAWGNSSVEAWGNSSVEAWENSSVVASGNSSVVIPYSTSIKIKGVYDYATIKDMSGNPIIYTANKDVNIKVWGGK